MKKSLLLIVILPALFLVSSCATLQDLASIKKPELSISSVNITDISLNDLELTFDVDVDNQNQVAVNLASYNFDFLIDGSSFVKGNQPLKSEIKSSAKSTVQIPVRFTFKELYQTFNSIRDKDETSYNLKAIVGVDLPVLGFTEVPIEKSGMFPVVKPPKISASKLSVKNLSFTKADLELELNIDNPNMFGISLNDLNYKVDVNGLNTISGTTTSEISIGEKGQNTVKIPVSFNLLQLGKSAYNLLKSDEPLEYSLSGSSKIGATLPFFDVSSYNFDRSGTLNIFN